MIDYMVIFIHSALCLKKKKIYIWPYLKMKRQNTRMRRQILTFCIFTLHVMYKIARIVHKAK